MDTDLEEHDADGSRTPDSDLEALRLRLRLPDRVALDDGSSAAKGAEAEAEFGADEEDGSPEPGKSTCFNNLARSLARLPPFINSFIGSFLRLRRSFDLEFCDLRPSLRLLLSATSVIRIYK